MGTGHARMETLDGMVYPRTRPGACISVVQFDPVPCLHSSEKISEL
jgi:hypothetical protein